jgi:hypothetical protein
MTCGTCGPKPADGTSCANQECGEGLQCANNVCVTPGAAGAACDNNKPCRGGLACKAATPGGNTGTCAIALKQGETCQELLGPLNAGCDPAKGLFCHPTMGVCTQVVYAKVGEACGITGTMFAVCTASAECRMQKCVAPAVDGAPCNTQNGPGCLAPAKCVGGLCKLEDPAACK